MQQPQYNSRHFIATMQRYIAMDCQKLNHLQPTSCKKLLSMLCCYYQEGDPLHSHSYPLIRETTTEMHAKDCKDLSGRGLNIQLTRLISFSLLVGFREEDFINKFWIRSMGFPEARSFILLAFSFLGRGRSNCRLAVSQFTSTFNHAILDRQDYCQGF